MAVGTLAADVQNILVQCRKEILIRNGAMDKGMPRWVDQAILVGIKDLECGGQVIGKNRE